MRTQLRGKHAKGRTKELSLDQSLWKEMKMRGTRKRCRVETEQKMLQPVQNKGLVLNSAACGHHRHKV